ncbi:hypothetical protein WSK_3786 [Novosphingobium sp. Rr 2-17]|uniref:helix-turn-helix domain-containing protein n=1 Tax=Novosphingobium sp. Rr 2-17 TaxID=555793 RepID=UPI00026985A3|nr:XRE family transcriptional regulator [Novosphingobium sp. Rr 2-17]EIZ77775.1 hypothetical protein WSK_3786 [Novosphingobium sp. Rr 2-17]
MFNPNRLSLARKRRRLTGKGLSEICGLTPVTISRLEKGLNEPEPESLEKLAQALRYPVEFFFGDDVEQIPAEAVSFRSLKKMSAKEREAAIAAGGLGLLVSDWVDERFNLPKVDFPVLDHIDAEVAAIETRQYWALGEKPIGNMIKLMESKGIRVFSLTERTAHVDAYSFWRDEIPFSFLNNFKTPEHSIFDCCHELGHLILHRHQGPKHHRGAEYEANKFASAFLMPRNDVIAHMPRFVTVNDILNKKSRWRVSAMALAYRLRDIDIISDWQYRSICIDLSQRGYRKGEPSGVERETSVLWKKVLHQLWSERLTKEDIAASVGIPFDELESLLFGITQSQNLEPRAVESRGLRLVS